MTLAHYLCLGAVLFGLGIFGALTRRNVLGILMSVELMFNAANINLVAFNRFLYPDRPWGHAFSLFVMAIAAAEAVVGLSILLAIYRNAKGRPVRVGVLNG
jgi:NADH:ubiquinone oxidoreductase subunit K